MSGLGSLGGPQVNAFNPVSSSDSLVIGPVTFQDEEHPNNLSFKLKQALSITTNVGGSRVIQALGTVPVDVTWTGELFDQNVQNRLAQIQAMEAAGQQVTLTYLNQSYIVVVSDFEAKYLHRWRAQYTITVSLLQPTSGQYSTTIPASINQQIDGCSASCQALITQMAAQDAVGTAAIQAEFQILFIAIEAAGLLSQLTGPNLQSLMTLVNAALGAASAYLATQGANGNSFQFLLSTQLVSYAQLIGRNLQAGQTQRVAIQQGGNLFALASKTYGDPTQAFALAAANGLISPVLPSGVTMQIVLPPLGSSGMFT